MEKGQLWVELHGQFMKEARELDGRFIGENGEDITSSDWVINKTNIAYGAMIKKVAK
jgi:hypothetical protein